MVTDLYDAIERSGLASYMQLTKEEKEYLLNCELKPTSQEKETICKSKQEFDAFVSKYGAMSEGRTRYIDMMDN